MKLRSIITIAFFGVAFAFTSCKKDRTCTCTTTYSDGTQEIDNYNINGKNIAGVPGTGNSKSEQKSICTAKNYTYSSSSKSCTLQ